MEPILSYIQAANEQALTREQDARRAKPLADDDDPRVDVCIYFLSPHRVKPIDLKFITELSVLAPVVPVLAKADSMTTDELNGFRSSVKAALAQVGLGHHGAVIWLQALIDIHESCINLPLAPWCKVHIGCIF